MTGLFLTWQSLSDTKVSWRRWLTLHSRNTRCQHIFHYPSAATRVNGMDTRLLHVKHTNLDVHDVLSHIDTVNVQSTRTSSSVLTVVKTTVLHTRAAPNFSTEIGHNSENFLPWCSEADKSGWGNYTGCPSTGSCKWCNSKEPCCGKEVCVYTNWRPATGYNSDTWANCYRFNWHTEWRPYCMTQLQPCCGWFRIWSQVLYRQILLADWQQLSTTTPAGSAENNGQKSVTLSGASKPETLCCPNIQHQ